MNPITDVGCAMGTFWLASAPSGAQGAPDAR